MGGPKPLTLCATVAGHPKALTADFRREYKVDLTELVDDERWWEIDAYVTGLPSDSALYREVRQQARRGDGEGVSRLTLADPVEASKFGTQQHIAELLLDVLNVLEADLWRQSDPDKRGPFVPSLPPGYEITVRRRDWNDPAFAAYRAAAAQTPQT